MLKYDGMKKKNPYKGVRFKYTIAYSYPNYSG